LENRTINIAVVAEVAGTLEKLNEKVVFVGGAIISLYADDPAADEIRPTQDVDVTLEILNLSHWEKVQNDLLQLGFSPDPFGHSICSYKYRGIAVDIISNANSSIGPSNRWYEVGFENLWSSYALDQRVNLLSAPCFLATKFEAFQDRGKDYRTSHDIEDIVYVLDNRINIVDEIKRDDPRVINYLKSQLSLILEKGLLTEVLYAHIHPLIIGDRLPIIAEKIHAILED